MIENPSTVKEVKTDEGRGTERRGLDGRLGRRGRRMVAFPE